MDNCSACGHTLLEPQGSKVRKITGLAIHLAFTEAANTETERRLLEEFGTTEFAFCYNCWVRSVGARPVNPNPKGETKE